MEGDERSRAKQLRLVESTGLRWRTARPNCQENCSPVLPLHRTAIPHHRFLPPFPPMCSLVRGKTKRTTVARPYPEEIPPKILSLAALTSSPEKYNFSPCFFLPFLSFSPIFHILAKNDFELSLSNRFAALIRELANAERASTQ